MKAQHIAIIGAGTAGLAAAIVLARQGHHITIYEAVEELSPVGAGLLLQPAGLAVFAHLGVLEHALSLGAVVTGLEGRLPSQQLLVNSHYAQAGQGLFGLGIHRATLCHVLVSALKNQAFEHHITWQMAADIRYVQPQQEGCVVSGTIKQQSFNSCFDVVIVANGARSQLRPQEWVKLDKAYPWGAAWTIVPECLALDTQILHQFYDGASLMMGVLPTGAMPNQPTQRLSSVFWSLPSQQLQTWCKNEAQRQDWLGQVERRWPIVAQWLATVIHQPEQWLAANYRDVVMSRFGQGRIGVIGDAAHAMSPQLGQGANMALLDAWALGQAFAKSNDFNELWQHYHQLRVSSTHFYQWLSRQLTPLYQSDNEWAAKFRDLTFVWMYRVPYLRKEMALTISGLKKNMLTAFSVEEISGGRVQ
ncbi:MAG: FAD-dependent monooxygenase [Moraxellaceae bacterium]|nr:FAD-dependent monooxygenase [Moraxellaceae bacterium]